jgi:hypothetical protein
MIRKQLQIEPVAQHVIGGGTNSENLNTCHRLIYVFDQLSGYCFIIPNRKIKSYVKVAFQDSLTSTGLKNYLYIIKLYPAPNTSSLILASVT